MISTMAPARPLPAATARSPRAAVIGGAPGSAGDGLHHGDGRDPAPPRRARRDRGAQLAGDGAATTATRRRRREASAHGWHHTGDIGYLDDDNFLFIVDRAKDMVITGGFNVYSTEVEQALMAHPDVQDCAVVGLPDERWGERVTAVLQLRRGPRRRHGRGDGLRQGADRQRQGAQAGRGLADLPRSKVGKVLKTDIKERLQHHRDQRTKRGVIGGSHHSPLLALIAPSRCITNAKTRAIA